MKVILLSLITLFNIVESQAGVCSRVYQGAIMVSEGEREYQYSLTQGLYLSRALRDVTASVGISSSIDRDDLPLANDIGGPMIDVVIMLGGTALLNAEKAIQMEVASAGLIALNIIRKEVKISYQKLKANNFKEVLNLLQSAQMGLDTNDLYEFYSDVNDEVAAQVSPEEINEIITKFDESGFLCRDKEELMDYDDLLRNTISAVKINEQDFN